MFAERYRAAYASIGQPLQAKDALEQVALERLLELKLPLALTEYYAVAGNERRLNLSFNRLLSPDHIFSHTGRTVFMEENQNVMYWGVRADSPDDNPMLEQGVNTGETLDWYAEPIDLAGFLELTLYLQASFGGGLKHCLTAPLTEMARQQLETSFRVVGRLDEFTAYARQGCALSAWSEGGWQLYGGFHTRKASVEIGRELGLHWDDL